MTATVLPLFGIGIGCLNTVLVFVDQVLYHGTEQLFLCF